MPGLDNILVNAAAPTLIVFLFIGYIQKRDIEMIDVLRDMTRSMNDLRDVMEKTRKDRKNNKKKHD